MNVVQFVSKNPKVSVSGLALVMGVGGSDDGLAQARRILAATKRWLATPMHLRTGGLELTKIACQELGTSFGAVEEPSAPYRDRHGVLQRPEPTDTLKVLDGYVEMSLPTYHTNELGLQVRGEDSTIIQRLRSVPVTYEMSNNREVFVRPNSRRELASATA